MADKTAQVLRYLDALRQQADRDPEGAGPKLAETLAAAVEAFQKTGDQRQSLLLAQELVARQRSLADPRKLAQALYVLGSCLVRTGAADEADAVLDECVALTDGPPADRFDTLRCEAREGLSALRARQGRTAEALRLLAVAIDGYRAMVDADFPRYGARLARSLHNRAVIDRVTGRTTEALAALDEAIDAYRSLLDGGDRAVAAGLGRSLATRKELAAEAGLPPDDEPSDELLQQVYTLATSANATFDPAPASQEPADGLPQATAREKPGDHPTMSSYKLIPLPDVVQAVRLQLEEATQNSGGYLGFEVGPIELDLTVSVAVSSAGSGGVRILVVTDGAAGVLSTGLHRMKLTLTPTSRTGGSPVHIGGEWGIDAER
jgi:tetratricopeptide (TPR) repeat protein